MELEVTSVVQARIETKDHGMKIAIVSSHPTPEHSLEAFYERAFQAIGHSVSRWSLLGGYGLSDRILNRHRSLRRWGIQTQLSAAGVVERISASRPDLTVVVRCETLCAESIRELRSRSSIACVNVYPDHPFVVPGTGAVQMADSLGAYDCVFTFAHGLVPVFYQLGARVVRRLAFGFDKSAHRVVSPSAGEQEKNVFSYFGTWGPIQQRFVSHFSDPGISVFGPGWRRLSRTVTGVKYVESRGMGLDMATEIGRTEVVTNLIRAEHGCGHSMKTFEILACGGFMLSNWTMEQAEFFDDERHCCYFNTFDEASDKARFYVKNPDVRMRIARAGLAEVQKHPYDFRAAEILSHFGLDGRA